VLFDFDGTLTCRDSLGAFLWNAYPIIPRMWRGIRAIPFWLMYQLGARSADQAKEAIFGIFFAGWEVERFRKYCEAFAHTSIPSMIRTPVYRILQYHRRRGDKVWIVSASPEDYLQPWTHAQGVQLIATPIEKKNGRLTGRFAGPNCRGQEKVRRIRENIDLAAYDEIIAYGDSPDDYPMMKLAHQAYYRPFQRIRSG